MKHFSLLKILFFVIIANHSVAQTVSVDNSTPGALATYTFKYVTSQSIGTGTTASNIFYLSKPTNYPSFKVINPLSAFAPYCILKVNGQTIPINSTNFGSIYGSWASGIQISTGGASVGTVIPAGAAIEIIVSGIITNPSSGNYTFQWQTAQGSGAAVETFSASLSFSGLAAEQFSKDRNIALYPNPSSNVVEISGIKKTENYQITDSTGKIMQSGSVSTNQKLNIQSLTNGVYFLKLENAEIIKFIKK